MAEENGTIDSSGQSLCKGKIEYFFTQKIVIEVCYKIVPMAKIQWYQEHPVMQSVPASVEVWSSQFFKPCGPASFMPIMRVYYSCVSHEAEVNNEKVLFVNSTRNKVFL